MYIQTSERLGETMIKKNGHERVKWSECRPSDTDPRQRSCAFNLKVKFWRSFEDFRKEVERAFRRWMTAPRARLLVQKREEELKNLHKGILDSQFLNVPDNGTPVTLPGEFKYRGPGSTGQWRIVDINLLALLLPNSLVPRSLQPPSLDQCRVENGFLVCKKPCVSSFPCNGWSCELAPGAADPSKPNECWYTRILTTGK